MIKNSQPFGKKFQKTVGGIFLTHTVCYSAYSAIARPSLRPSNGWIIEKPLTLWLWNFHHTVAPSL